MSVTISGNSNLVLQVVSATKTDTFSSASTSFTDITGLSVTITPTSASSKILVFANVLVGTSSTNESGLLQIVRDSTAIGTNTGSSSGRNGYGTSGSLGNSVEQYRAINSSGLTILDSPSTTSATTYKIQLRSAGGTSYMNRWTLSGDLVGSSSITVMEIAA